MANNNDQLYVDPALLRHAEQACRRRLESDPDNRAAIRSLAEVYRKLGDLGHAAAAYQRLVRLDPQDPEAGYLESVCSGTEWPGAPPGIRAAPFVLLKDFLPAELHDSLIPFLVSRQDSFVPARILDAKGERHYKPSYRDSLGFQGEWQGMKRFSRSFTDILPGLFGRLHVAPFAIDKIELDLRAYRDGHFFKMHVDGRPSVPATANRIVSLVYYFHRQPRPYTGGELILFDSDPDSGQTTKARFTQVVPEDNTLLVFPSRFYHCVVPIQCPGPDFGDSRFVINGFVHQRVGAIEETGPRL